MESAGSRTNCTRPKQAGEVMLSAADQHLHNLTAAWGMVADFCFGDLLLFVPTDAHPSPVRFAIRGQVRPTTSRTLYQDDLVGQTVSVTDRPLLADCFVRSRLIEGQNIPVAGSSASATIDYVPVVVRINDVPKTIAVLTRESTLDPTKRPGRLERTYVDIYIRIASMISEGLFPYSFDADADAESLDPPRVGDGVIVLNSKRTITYASPNAVSSLHRLGMQANAEGRTLGALGIGLTPIDAVFTSGQPVLTEIERINPQTNARMILAVHALPLQRREGGIEITDGAVLLMRDVSDIRRRDRLLITKDATIREVHHRVKNNLQTISALLRLQGRRTTSPEAREAIEESARRIRAIALVHETLAQDVRDAVPFDDIVRPLVRMVEESIVSPDAPVNIRVSGQLGDLAPEIATPLSLSLTELLQNAVEHGFPAREAAGDSQPVPGEVHVILARRANELTVTVRDNGAGLPADFSLGTSTSLGLSIVRTLVTTELRGVISLRTDHGTVAEIRIPI